MFPAVSFRLYPNPSEHKTRVNYYKQYESEFNVESLTLPVTIDEVTKFEDLNPNFSVNVFGYDQQEIHPMRVTKYKNGTHHVNLLLLSNEQGNTHYCLISDLSQLLSNLTKHKSAMHYCNYCLCRFANPASLINHTCTTPPV